MKNTPKRKQRNKPGVVLFTAVAVMLMLSILLTATVSYVSVNRTKTNDNYKSKQAYLTASSTLESFINQIQLILLLPMTLLQRLSRKRP